MTGTGTRCNLDNNTSHENDEAVVSFGVHVESDCYFGIRLHLGQSRLWAIGHNRAAMHSLTAVQPPTEVNSQFL